MHFTTPFTNSWISSADHCTWYGVTCGEDWENKTESWNRVTELDFNNTNWSQAYFQEYRSFPRLEVLRTNQNFLTGSISSQLCSISTTTDLTVVGDETNCPNILTEAGCCDEVKLTVPSPYLDSIVESELGSADCGTLSVSNANVCTFMKNKVNHIVFQDDDKYPDPLEFNYEDWLKERVALAQIFFSTSLVTVNPTWLNQGDHCSWSGVTCSNDEKVTSLALNNLDLTGPFPSNLGKLSALTSLVSTGNSLEGPLAVNDICTNTYIAGDETNCPNAVDETGCCDVVRMTNPSPYLDRIVESELGTTDCGTLSTSDSSVCNFMRNKASHYVFDDGQYPAGFPYENWLKVSKTQLSIFEG